MCQELWEKTRDLYQAGRLSEAERACRQLLDAAPHHAQAWFHLGLLAYHAGRVEEAIASYENALRCKAEYPEAHNNLGIALARQGRFDEAVAEFERALAIKPDYAEAHNNLGRALYDRGEPAAAVEPLRQALRLRPGYAEAHGNLAAALVQRREFFEAFRHYDHAVRLKPDLAETHLGRAVARLLLGDFDQGWREYEWRWKCPGFDRREFTKPLWRGEPLEGRSVLLAAEPSTRDTIQLVRYARLVQERGGRVILLCPKPLIPILRTCRNVDVLCGDDEPLPEFDFHVPLGSLPGIFQTTLATIPNETPYLFAEPDLIDRWKDRLSYIRAFKVGIAWQGSPGRPGALSGSIPLAYFAALAAVPGVRLIGLQKGVEADPIREARFPLTELAGELDEVRGRFMDTAAVLKNLDLLITADTALAHLGGALGVPVWVLLPHVPDWRWLLDRDDSPWYPTVRIFRQAEVGNWEEVFCRIAAALAGAVSEQGGRDGSRLVAETSPGELIDRITILRIKSQRISDAQKLRNVSTELAVLTDTQRAGIPPSERLEELTAELQRVNEALWEIEDEIRCCEARQDFGDRFIQLARSVYRTNDRRAALKRAINEALGSRIAEEKQYVPYEEPHGNVTSDTAGRAREPGPGGPAGSP